MEGVGAACSAKLITLLRQQAEARWDALQLSRVDVRLGEFASLSITSSRISPEHQHNLQGAGGISQCWLLTDGVFALCDTTKRRYDHSEFQQRPRFTAPSMKGSGLFHATRRGNERAALVGRATASCW